MSATLPAPEHSAEHAAEPPVRFHLPSYLLGLVTALILLGTSLFLLRRPEPAAVQLQPPPVVPSAVPTVPPDPPTPTPLVVFVSGAVQHPGLYTLPANSRIGDAIAAAGGLLPEVDPAFVNQAQTLVDGAQLHIPPAAVVPPAVNAAVSSAGQPVEQSVPQPDQPAVAAAPAAGLTAALPTPTSPARTTAVDLTAAGQSGSDPGSAAGTAAGLINVNTATAAELDSLPGIGPAKAQGIIDNRPYANVDELDRVPGIGPATLDRLRPLVTTS